MTSEAHTNPVTTPSGRPTTLAPSTATPVARNVAVASLPSGEGLNVRCPTARLMTATVAMIVPTTRLAFTDRQLRRVVEPGAVELFVGRSCLERGAEERVVLVGEAQPVGTASPRWVETDVRRG